MRTYGTIHMAGEFWNIEAEAHVVIRLKRLFGKLGKSAKSLSIRHTPDVARDLAWVMERYPLVISEIDRKVMDQATVLHVERSERFVRVLSGASAPRAFTLKLPAREYQLVAADLALQQGGLLLADEVGLGKTCSSICMLTDPGTRPALVVTLTHLPKQWTKEIARFAPSLRTHVLKKTKPYPLPDCDVIVTSYSKLSGWAPALAGTMKTVVFDEVQELRHPDSERSRAAREIASGCTYRLGCSATPIFNYGNEFFNVLDVLRPGELGTKTEFIREWCTEPDMRGKASVKDPKAFGAYLREQGMMIRRTRQDVGRELPGLTIIPDTVASGDVFEELERDGKGDVSELARFILERDSTKGIEQMQARGELDWRLRQATGIAKCMAPGTKVIMSDGSSQPVESLKVGDLLLGPDGSPRRILTTVSGHGEMFRVSSTARAPLFEPYEVNGDHILALKHSGKIRHGDRFLFAPYVRGDHVEVSVSDYLKQSKHFRRLLKGYKTGVELPEQKLPLDPYFLGLWLGDGSSATSAVTTADPEIVDYLRDFARRHEVSVRAQHAERTAPTYYLSPPGRGGDMRRAKNRNPVLKNLCLLGVIGNKHVPDLYLRASRAQRMSLLAGLIDSDGSLNSPGGYTIVTRWAHLSGEMCRLAWSLGLAAKSRLISARNQSGKRFPAHRIHIYGNGLESLPLLVPRKRSAPRRQIKDPLRSGISVTPVGLGPYFGFTLDGDGLFLLHDFTVTHNSKYIAEFVRMLVDNGERVLLYTWHHAVNDILCERLKDVGVVKFTGEESATQKQAALDKFKGGHASVLIMSLRAGAGVDGLQSVCRTVVYGELDWSPSVHHQGTGRVFRDGQAHPVVAYFLVSEQGSDPVLQSVLGLKRGQLDGVVNPDGAIFETVKTGGIADLAKAVLARRARKPQLEMGTEAAQ